MIINAHSAGELAAQANNVGARFIYISTDSVFDGISGGYAETDVARPQNSYARSKLAGEEAVLRATRRALVLRVNFFAWNMQRKDSLAEWILSRLKRGEAVPGFSDTTFSPVLANDISGWILRLVDLDFNGILHMGSADHCSKYEFAREIAKVFQFDDSLIRRTLMEESTLLAPRPRNTWLRTESLRNCSAILCLPSGRGWKNSERCETMVFTNNSNLLAHELTGTVLSAYIKDRVARNRGNSAHIFHRRHFG